MIQFAYLAVILGAMAGMAVIDWRYKLALWHDRNRTLAVLAAGVALFILWDILGIHFGIFRHGGSPYSLPLRIAPEFPIEELFFLTHLCYTTLVTYRFFERKYSR